MPSSIVTFFRCWPACAATIRPTRRAGQRDLRISAPISAFDRSEVAPQITEIVPAAAPPQAAPLPISHAVPACRGRLHTTGQPAPSAGATFCMVFHAGKFRGVEGRDRADRMLQHLIWILGAREGTMRP